MLLRSSSPARLSLPEGVTQPRDFDDRRSSIASGELARLQHAQPPLNGRMGLVVDGDSRSPRLGSYVLFSQVVQRPSQAFQCYQESDPTSNVDNVLVDSDGGYVQIDGAYNIVKMVELQESLFVFAENGVWRISGGDEGGFRATSFTVSKISDQGCVSPNSVVRTPDSVVFWGRDAIYALTQNQAASWSVVDISTDKIKSFYENIPQRQKQNAFGTYDSSTTKICWLYSDNTVGRTDSNLLYYDILFRSYTSDLVEPSGALGNGLHSVVFIRRRSFVGTPTNPNRDKDGLHFLVVTDRVPISAFSMTVSYAFANVSTELPTDWISQGGNDVDAFIETGPLTGGDARLRKDIPYVTTYMEDKFNTSSMLLSSRWDWRKNVESNRWSTPRQVYRPNKFFKDGDIVVSKSRIRGRGHAVSLRFESEGNNNIFLYGWEYNLESTAQE